MIQQIISLLSKWQQRQQSSDNADYKIAIAECHRELQQILEDSEKYQEYMDKFFSSLPSEEVQEYLDEIEADNYLASLEAHESAA